MAAWLSALVRRAVSGISDAFGSRADWPMEPAVHGNRDPDSDAAFYQKLFNYDVFELPASPGVQHLLLSSDNYARASANTNSSW